MGRSLAFLALIGVVLVGAACGGSDGGGGAAASERPGQEEQALTRSEFVARAKAICIAADETLPPGARDAPTEKQLAIAMDAWNRVVRQLRELKPPRGEAARVDRMLTHFENAIRAGRQAFTASDESALAVFAGLFDQASKGAAIANSYGLDVCSPVPVLPSTQELWESSAYQQAMLDFIRQFEESDLPTLTEP